VDVLGVGGVAAGSGVGGSVVIGAGVAGGIPGRVAAGGSVGAICPSAGVAARTLEIRIRDQRRGVSGIAVSFGFKMGVAEFCERIIR
jgi:hypothetical protein